MNRYWVLLYDPEQDRQLRVFRAAPTLEAAKDHAVESTGLPVIAAGLQREGVPAPDGEPHSAT